MKVTSTASGPASVGSGEVSLQREHPASEQCRHRGLVPNQTFDTIGDLLSEANLSWAWYAGGWNDAITAATTDAAPPGFGVEMFQYHHQPFVYFANFADGTAAKAQHLTDETDFISAAAAGQLPRSRS